MPVLSPADRPDGPSEAEALVFDALRHLPDDWFVIHSLWLDTHLRKTHAEIDFVVIGERAVLLLEVKGGRLSRDASGWHFLTKAGRPVALRRDGPFDQVRGAYYALKAHMERVGRMDLFYAYAWGYGVVLPECILSFPGRDPDIPEEAYLDMRGFPAGMPAFLDGLASHWQARCREVQAAHGRADSAFHTVIPVEVRKTIFSILRPDIRSSRGAGAEALEVDRRIRALTGQQLTTLDLMDANPRIIVRGAAGTGKTVLATEQALRQAGQGRRVLFTCFNRLLAEEVRQATDGVEGLTVANYHQFVVRILRSAGMGDTIPGDWNAFNRSVEELMLKALEALGERHEPFDYIVMDEAQDLLAAPFLGALDLVLSGGIKEGRWMFCLDPDQTIFVKNFDASALADMERNAAIASLEVNCRNSQEITAHVTGLTKLGATRTRNIHGPDVRVDYYSGPREYSATVRRAVNRAVADLDQVGVPASEVVILAEEISALPEAFREAGFFLRPVATLAEPRPGHLRMGTVQSFKGLEASAVILVATADIGSLTGRRLLYVGGSRAKAILHLVLPAECDALVRDSLPLIMSLLKPNEGRPGGAKAPTEAFHP